MLGIITIQSNIKNYDIEFIESIDIIIDLVKQPNTLLLIDKNVKNLYPIFNDLNNTICVECIEENKNLEGCASIFKSLIEHKTNIKTKIIAVGGGILQDLVGFCASTFCRGLDYILIPTTLLAQADSCIGGKTSLNFANKKNILGTFYPPSKIIIYTKFLETLSTLEFLSGIGEIYKFHILQNQLFTYPINDITHAIKNALLYKSSIITKDEFDTGERKMLNFGHTFGHALESTSSYEIPHGIAIIIGSMIALRLSKFYGYNVPNYEHYIERGLSLIKETKINFDKSWFNYDNLLEITKSDKKNTGKLTMVLINDVPIIQSLDEFNYLEKSIINTYESL